MAFDFGATRLNRLTSTSVLTAADPRPCTIAFWIKMATTGDREFGASQWVYENTHGSGGSNFSVSISWFGSENYLRLFTNGTHYASGAWTPTTAWQSFALSFATGTPGAVAFYRNGAALGTTTATLGGTTTTASATIGGFATVASGLDPSNDAHYHTALGHNIDGSLGEMVLWNVVLTPAEAQGYTAGGAAQQIRPAAIRCHMPFIASVTQDLYRGAVWTAQGTNTKQADHPRIFLPTAAEVHRPSISTPTGTGAGTIAPLVGAATGAHWVGLEQAAFRFGINEGTESTHGWHAAQNVSVQMAADTTFLLRFLIQCSGAARSNLDFQIQYNKNAAGWNNITTSSAVARATSTVAFTEGANTTNRLTGGTGTFETSSAGCSVDGISGGTAFDIVAGGFGETEFALTIPSADVTVGDTVDFRLLVDGAVLEAYSRTPSVTFEVASVTGAGDGTLDQIGGNGSGSHGVAGTAAGTLAPLVGAAIAVHGVAGTAAGAVAPLVGAASGNHAPYIATAAGTISPLVGAATAAHGVAGTAASVVAPLVGAATATHVPHIGTAAGAINRLVGAAGAGHGVAGQAAGAIATLTGAASATHIPHSGTAAGILAPLVGAASAAHGVAGTAASTLAPLVGAASATHIPHSGTGVGVRNPLIGAASAGHGVAGQAAGVINRLVGAAAGVQGFAGSASGTINPLVGSASGTVGGFVVFGGGAGIIAPLVGAATAVHGVAGTAAGAITPLVGAAAATHIPHSGAGAGTLAPLTGAATATHVPHIGTAAGVIAPLVGAATGQHITSTVSGSAAGVRNPLVGSATAAHGVAGTAAGTIAPLVGAATGVQGVPGTAAGTIAPLVGAAVATHIPHSGTAAGILAPLVGAAVGARGEGGTAAGTLAPLTGAAIGEHGSAVIAGTAAGQIRPLAGQATGVLGVAGSAAGAINRLVGVGLASFGVIHKADVHGFDRAAWDVQGSDQRVMSFAANDNASIEIRGADAA